MNPILPTDKYKMVMAQAGFPLREETFVFSMRKGGPWVMPIDPKDLVARVLRCDDIELPDFDESVAYLRSQKLDMPQSYFEAMAGHVRVTGVPKGCWFGDREPILTITGPSALVSNIEARIIGELTFRIQTATLARLDPDAFVERYAKVTCEREREIVLETVPGTKAKLEVDSKGYFEHIRKRAKTLVGIVGSPLRVMEAGYRAASCYDQHRLAVAAVREGGFRATSNVLAARELGMTPAGTTGHEHTQRWGSDYEAFTSVRDMVSGEVTYLLDTFSTRHSGLPTALRVMQEDPDRASAIRFDSESTMVGDYLLAIQMFKEAGLPIPGLNLGGGFNFHTTAKFEELRQTFGVKPRQQRYMYGQYLVEPHVPLPTRGDVGAVYKLSQTGSRATMKFSDNPAKASSPGKPVVFRLEHPEGADFTDMPLGIIGQEGEEPPRFYRRLDSEDSFATRITPGIIERFRKQAAANSPATQALVDQCTSARSEALAQLATTF